MIKVKKYEKYIILRLDSYNGTYRVRDYTPVVEEDYYTTENGVEIIKFIKKNKKVCWLENTEIANYHKIYFKSTSIYNLFMLLFSDTIVLDVDWVSDSIEDFNFFRIFKGKYFGVK